mmetsp:Transcript_1516/g.4721  ORF Transcript_1516/g.4721 Transcript_1516/m.4721 type:complete len:417 (+) Transcript_1516:670-1920(+)
MLLNRLTGMSRASQASAQVAMTSRSTSSRCCSAALLPRLSSMRKDTEHFMHSSRSSSNGMALQKTTSFRRSSSSLASFGALWAEGGRPVDSHSFASASAPRASRQATCRMASATAWMLPRRPTGTSPRSLQASAQRATMSRSASSARFSASLMPPPRPPFETRSSWHSLRSSLRGSSLQQAAHRKRSSKASLPSGTLPASGGRPSFSYSARRAASLMASSCVTLLITEFAASTSASLRTGMPRFSQRAASHGVRQMPVARSSARRRRSSGSLGRRASNSSVSRPILRHSSSSSCAGISRQTAAAFSRLSSSSLPSLGPAFWAGPSASCSASSSSSDISSRRPWRSATFRASLGPSCCTGMPRASHGSRHIAQTKSHCVSLCRSPLLPPGRPYSWHSRCSCEAGSSSSTSIRVRQSR